jgi:hypothetical protein
VDVVKDRPLWVSPCKQPASYSLKRKLLSERVR